MVNVTLFPQIIQKIDKNIFENLVHKYNSDKYQKGMNSWTHLISMLGIKSAPSKSSLSYQNKNRTSELFRDT